MQEIPAEDPEFSPTGVSLFADDEEHISLDGLHAPDEAQTEISPTIAHCPAGGISRRNLTPPTHPTKRSMTQPYQNRPLKTAKTL